MYAYQYSFAGEWLPLPEFGFQLPQDRHVAADPVNFLFARGGGPRGSNDIWTHDCLCRAVVSAVIMPACWQSGSEIYWFK
jgi:hypothetical protein